MNVHYCDNCGEKIGKNPDALMLIALRDPEAATRRATNIFEAMADKVNDRKEERFELCATCGLGLLVTMKAKKLAVREGRAGGRAGA